MISDYLHTQIGIKNGYYAIVNGVTIVKQDESLETIKRKIVKKIISQQTRYINRENTVTKGYLDLLNEYDQPQITPAGLSWVELIVDRNKFITINTAVDAYNLQVAKSLLAFGAHDISKIKGKIVFDYAKDGDFIIPVNTNKKITCQFNNYVYRDEEKILAWLDAKDSDLAKIDLETKDILLIVEGNRNTTPEYIKEHLQEACERVIQVCGGNYIVHKLVKLYKNRI